MVELPQFLMVAGLLTALYGGLSMLSAALSISILWGFLIVLIPITNLIFLVTYWDEAKGPFLLCLTGGFILGAGISMATPTPRWKIPPRRHAVVSPAAQVLVLPLDLTGPFQT